MGISYEDAQKSQLIKELQKMQRDRTRREAEIDKIKATNRRLIGQMQRVMAANARLGTDNVRLRDQLALLGVKDD